MREVRRAFERSNIRVFVVLAALSVGAPLRGEAAPAVVSPEATQAKVYFKAGRASFDKHEYQAAYEAFQKSLQIRRNFAAIAMMASSCDELGRYDDALELYEQALSEFPNASAANRKDAEEKRAALLAKVGTISLEGDVPAGGKLFVDDREAGTLPLPSPVRVAAGLHEIRAEKSGFPVITTTVDVSAGKSFVAKLAAKPRKGRLEIREKHNWVLRVEIDGKDVGTTPWSDLVEVGEHRVRLHGFMGVDALLACEAPEQAAEAGAKMASEEEKIAVGFYEAQPLTLSAEELDASLRVDSNPTGSLLRIDGTDYGKTPWEGRLPLGEHRIEVRTIGFFKSTQILELEKRRQREVTLSLERVPPPPGFWTGRRVGAASAYGGALLGFGLFGVTAGLAWDASRGILDRCNGNMCPDSVQKPLDEVHALQNAALAGLVVGGAGVAAGTALVLLDKPSSPERRGRLGLGVGLGGITIEGAF